MLVGREKRMCVERRCVVGFGIGWWRGTGIGGGVRTMMQLYGRYNHTDFRSTRLAIFICGIAVEGNTKDEEAERRNNE